MGNTDIDTDIDTTTNITATVENFLEGWDRQEWMEAHGSWASEQWDEAREAYEGSLEALTAAVEDLETEGHWAHHSDTTAVREALEAVECARDALDGQVTPDHDHIAEGVIDPDGIGSDPDAVEIAGVGEAWEGWDCREGWDAYRHQGALYMRWWREGWGARRSRVLWVPVDEAE